MAVGLGELHGRPVLGDRLELSINIFGDGRENLDAGCFRLVRPRGGEDLPWLREADLRVRSGKSETVLLISGRQILRDPLVKVAVHMACGHELYREYTVLAKPAMGVDGDAAPPVARSVVDDRPSAPSRSVRPDGRSRSAAAPSRAETQRREPKKGREVPVTGAGQREGDRLMLSSADVGGDAVLRLSPLLAESPEAVSEARREMLRLEYRMLSALHDQANGQLEMAEKLRAMESSLSDLQGRALALTESAGRQGSPGASGGAVGEVGKAAGQATHAQKAEDSGWWFYGLLLGAILVVATGLFLRNRQRRLAEGDSSFANLPPEPLIDAPRRGELDDAALRPAARRVDLPLEAPAPGSRQSVDVELAGSVNATAAPRDDEKAEFRGRPGDSVLSINATTLDEHFEANPVMELADIMLSFGRVKGAAQALQEYIDNNPQEALQPWIRLMDVYRMAGMREEFEAVARNLNQHFNVAVQAWDAPPGGAVAEVDLELGETTEQQPAASPVVPQSLEEMPRIVNSVVRMWESGDVVTYLHELLRDNRGGQRQGFALPVVEDILFLIDLKEAVLRTEKEGAKEA